MLTALFGLLACSGSTTKPAQERPPEPAPSLKTASTPAAEGAPLKLGAFVQFSGLCEPSGVALDGDTLRMVDDDRKKLVFSVSSSGGATSRQKRVWEGDDLKLNDAEAVAVVGASRWWTTSHSRNRDGELRKDQRIIKTDASGLTVEAVHSLTRLRETLTTLTATCPDCTVSADFEAKRSKEGGLDIEGLAAGRDDALMVGLRGPLTTQERALVLSMPISTLDDGTVAAAWALDLDGRGVRSMARLPGEDTYLLIAGPMGSGERFSLYRWSPGTEAVELGAIPLPEERTAPEGLAIQASTAEAVSMLVVYDEGRRVQHAEANPEEESCDDLLDEGSEEQKALVTARLLPVTWSR